MSEEAVEIPIKLDVAAQARKRQRERMAQQMIEARTMEKFGTKVMKVKIRALAAIGADVEKMGVKQIGHGKIALAGDMAQTAVEHLVDLVHDLKARVPACDPDTIIDAMREMRAFNEQLMNSGKAHIDADKQLIGGNTGPHLTVPFPAGTPLVVGIAPTKPMQVEDATTTS